MAVVGICARDVPGAAQGDLYSVARTAASFGFGAVTVPSLRYVSAELDPAELAEARGRVGEAGVELWAAAGMLNAHHLERSPDLVGAAGDGDPLVGLEQLVAAAEIIGQKELTVIIGVDTDRADVQHPWCAQLDATAELLGRMGPLLRERRAQLQVKTHEEITTREVVELVERVGPDVLSVAFDPVNVVVRGELPSAAAARVRPYMAALHLDDAWLCPAPDGLVRRFSPLGAGCLPWPAMLTDAAEHRTAGRPRLLVDLHRGELATPYLRTDWQALQDVDPDELRELRAQAVPDPDAVPDIPSRFEAAVAALTGWNLLSSAAAVNATETGTR